MTLRAWTHRDGRLVPAEDPAAAVWLDLLDPDEAGLAEGARLLGAALPTREEMEEIEHSSRVWRSEGTAYLTVMVPTRPESGERAVGPVAFVLRDGRLATVRRHSPQAFDTYPARAGADGIDCDTGAGVLHGLVESVVDRLADILERIGAEVDAVSRAVARNTAADRAQRADLRRALGTVSGEGDLLSDVRIGLLTLQRALAFLDNDGDPHAAALAPVRRVQARDVESLVEHAGFLSQKITLALETTLGMISIEQNESMRVMGAVSVLFLPPTLIASVYGMNFEGMPELGWPFGYPFSLLLMVAAAAASLWALRRRGWF